MALYDGFFDAVQDEDTGEYDRAYSSGDFTGYYANLIGSGVCVHDNQDSFLVRLEDGAAVVSPGYLFIRGYWLKNDADYTIDLPGTSNYAILAHLNLGQRLIELKADSVAQAYPDSLVLAIVSPTSAEDTRYNTDICGVIDTAGELSNKTAWAINYINNEIDSKLAQVEQDIAAQDAKLTAKIAEVQAVADSIVPPPVGSIKFSASQDVGEEWLQCDGSFINESDYPELVAALGKLTPSGDKFQLISNGEIGPQISNGALYDGRLWVYSYTAKKLYGVDVEGTEGIKEITVTSEDEHFDDFIPPNNTNPIALSIVPHTSGSGAKLFLSQLLMDGILNSSTIPKSMLTKYVLIFESEFSSNENELSFNMSFKSAPTNKYPYVSPKYVIPFVISRTVSGVETYYCAIGTEGSTFQDIYYFGWGDTEETAKVYSLDNTISNSQISVRQRASFNRKNSGELVVISSYANTYKIESAPNGLFSGSGNATGMVNQRNDSLPLNLTGPDKVLFSFDLKTFPWTSPESGVAKSVNPGLKLPSASRIFPNAGAYLWGKDIYMVFVGTGIIFSRTLEEGDFGYLDTTSVLGTITQFGYLDYSQDEGTLYLLGQDTTNTVKAAKIVLNTLYDYANDGAWLPMIASDGVPAYIKACETGGGVITDPVEMTINVLSPTGFFSELAEVIFNGSVLIAGAYNRTLSESGTFTVGFRVKTPFNNYIGVKLNGSQVVYENVGGVSIGYEKTVTFNVADFISNGISLQGF